MIVEAVERHLLRHEIDGMKNRQNYIEGAWTEPSGIDDLHVTDSYSEETVSSFRSSSIGDVDRAVRAAERALPEWSAVPVEQRAALVREVARALRGNSNELADMISREVGMPRRLAGRIQVEAPISAIVDYADLAVSFHWEQRIRHSLIQQLPVGVVACITPWNYPQHQIIAKVVPALLAGCTVVLKPSELAPSSAVALATAMEQANLPAGVFNLIHGRGEDIGEALVKHPRIDMVSFTGSTRAGRRISGLAGQDIKRLALELGGKSAALVTPGADVVAAVKGTLASCFLNSGQTCSAMTRLLVPHELQDKVSTLARDGAAGYLMGDPFDSRTRLGPLVSGAQRTRVAEMIDSAIQAGAARWTVEQQVPARGFFVPPTVLGNVTPDMEIAREEVFGPVLSVIGYGMLDEAIDIANGTEYGLAASVWGSTTEEAVEVAARLRAGQVDINGATFNPAAPFGGFKKSGVGRENGRYGIEEFVEPRSIQFPVVQAGTAS